MLETSKNGAISMFKFMFDKLYDGTEYLPTDERISIVVGVLFVIVNWLLNLLFFFVFIFIDLLVMSSFNAISLVIGLINMYILVGTKFKNVGITLMIYNICFYIGFSSFLLGYDKNAIVLIPLMVLVTFSFFAKKPKFLAINLFAIFLAYGFNIYVKYSVTSMYQEVAIYADYVNNIFAIFGTIWFIYASSKVESYAKEFTERKIENLSEEANVDFLTGLKNRRYMENFLSNISELSDGYLILGDIDFFKNVNDSYGHNCGDYILKEISTMLTNSFDPSNPICRWGGEEFLIYIKDTPNLNIENKLNELRLSIEEKEFEYNDLSIHITITFGYSKINNYQNVSKNIRNADIALYYGKSTGRNSVINFQDIIRK